MEGSEIRGPEVSLFCHQNIFLYSVMESYLGAVILLQDKTPGYVICSPFCMVWSVYSDGYCFLVIMKLK